MVNYKEFPSLESCIESGGKTRAMALRQSTTHGSILMTPDGACYDDGSPEYDQVEIATVFPSMSACLGSGGSRAHAAVTNNKDQKLGGKTESENIVKLSRNRICHDRSSPYYSRTRYFTSFATMEKCLAAGGRKPKT
jgi:hypothetical protein